MSDYRGDDGPSDPTRFVGAVLLVVLSTILVGVVGTVLTQALFDEPSIIQEISVSVILCAGALWALVVLLAMRR
jgi:hypothetical protein